MFSKGGQLEVKSGQSEIAQHLTRTVVLVFGVRLVKGGRDHYGGLGLYDYNVLFVIMDMHGLYTG